VQRVRDVYGQDFAKAKTSQDKAALARRLLQVARDETKDLPARFALLNSVADLSADAGDLGTAFAAINELFKTFDVDRFTPKLRAGSVAIRAVKTGDQRRQFAAAVEEMVGWSAWADRYDEAREFGRLAMGAARGDPPLLRRVSGRVKQAAELQSLHAALAGARQTLIDDPADAAANLAVGRFRCLVKGDWRHGLPLLAIGSDPGLRDTATLDLKGASTAEEQVTVGDAWWAVAVRLSGVEQARAQAHAAAGGQESPPQQKGAIGAAALSRHADIPDRAAIGD